MRRRPSLSQLHALALVGVLLELVLLIGVLYPFALWRVPDVVVASRPLAQVLGYEWTGAARFAATVLLASLLFAVAAWLAERQTGRGARALVLAMTALYALTLLPINPVGAQDIYHNIADARTVWHYGDNPLVLPPAAYPDDPLAARVPAWQSTPSLYGPVWYLLAGVVTAIAGDGLWANVLGHKALTALFLLVVTALAIGLTDRLHLGTHRGAAAGVLVGWNPLLQFETAGNAHNDVVMVAFALGALGAVSARRWWAVFPLLALAVATKYVLVVLAPVLLVWLLSRRTAPRAAVFKSLLLGAAVGGTAMAPFVIGMDLLDAFWREGCFISASPAALLHTLLGRVMPGDGLHRLSLVRAVLWPIAAAAYAAVLRRMARAHAEAAVASACFWVIVLVLVLGLSWFGPWYLMLAVPFAALRPGSRAAWVAVAWSVGALLLYVPDTWLPPADPLVRQATLVSTALGPPLLLALGRRWIHPGWGAAHALLRVAPAPVRGGRVERACRTPRQSRGGPAYCAEQPPVPERGQRADGPSPGPGAATSLPRSGGGRGEGPQREPSASHPTRRQAAAR